MPPENPPAPEVDEDEPVSVADKPREPTEYERRLRRESAGYRQRLREAEARIAERETALKAEHEAALAAQARAHNERLIRAELRAAAKDAGMVDTDGLRLLDTSSVTLAADGSVVIPDKFFDTARAAKPYLFKATGADAGTTSGTAKEPPAATPSAKRVGDMTPAERTAAAAALGIKLR